MHSTPGEFGIHLVRFLIHYSVAHSWMGTPQANTCIACNYMKIIQSVKRMNE
jgi:hypothetical protein